MKNFNKIILFGLICICLITAGSSFATNGDSNTISNSKAVSLNDAINAPNTKLNWENDPNNPWQVSENPNPNTDGKASVRSGSITHNEKTTIQTTVYGSGTIKWRYTASCEPYNSYYNYGDSISFVTTNVVNPNNPNQIYPNYIDSYSSNYAPDNLQWKNREFKLSSGTHILKFYYEKDKSVSLMEDCGWVDQVEWIPDSPELYITSLNSATKAIKGQKLNIANAVKNQGKNSGGFSVNYYLKNTSTGSKTYIGYGYINSLAIWATNSQTNSITIPTNIAAGNYQLLAVVDANNLIQEGNENNNQKSGPTITVLNAYKDLVVSYVSTPSVGYRGRSFLIKNDIKNQGTVSTASFWVYFYLQASSSSPKIFIGRRLISGLGPGATNSQNTYITIPTKITPRSYQILVTADATKAISESSESNNNRYSLRTNIR